MKLITYIFNSVLDKLSRCDWWDEHQRLRVENYGERVHQSAGQALKLEGDKWKGGPLQIKNQRNHNS